MKDNIAYWMWLQECLGPAKKIQKLLLKYKDAESFYKAGEKEWKAEISSPMIREKMRKKKPSDFYERIEFCKNHKIHILCPDDEYYPRQLLEIETYPLVLYIRGDYKIFAESKCIAVIGSRTPCVYGEKAAVKIVSKLAKEDYVIVSGGALGIDSVAHKAAIDNGGKTALIMGCGHGSDYLPENSELRKAVAMHGALVTEYPPKNPVTRSSFPERNRLISALSKGVVIVEAAEFSGTFSTANHALDQNKDVFVLPGDIDSGNFAGSNRLITDGAVPVFSGEDVLLYYGDIDYKSRSNIAKTGEAFDKIDVDSQFSKKNSKHYRTKKKTTQQSSEDIIADITEDEEKNSEKSEKIQKNCPEGISNNAKIVYNIMLSDICNVDEISRKSGLEIRKVLVAMTELEMSELVESSGPGEYCFK